MERSEEQKINRIFVSEVFEGIQGEGRYIGYPALFIRTFGCSRDCDFCDSNFSKFGKYKEFTIQQLIDRIKKSKVNYVVWTGGEPLLQITPILQVVKKTRRSHPSWRFHHLETNGDLIDKLRQDFNLFDYIAISPKEVDIARKVYRDWNLGNQSDIKVVTDLEKVGVEMLRYATLLMPLTTGNKKKDKQIEQRVWKYCIKNNIRYSPRLQVEVWGFKKRKV